MRKLLTILLVLASLSAQAQNTIQKSQPASQFLTNFVGSAGHIPYDHVDGAPDVSSFQTKAGVLALGGFSSVTGAITIGNVAALQTALDARQSLNGVLALGNFSSVTGTLGIANVSSLQAALDAKAPLPDNGTRKIITVSSGSAATDTRTGLSSYDSTKPFATLGAAKTAASSGDTIVIGPGNYSATNLLKDGVDWILMSKAKVTNSSSTSAIFDDWTSGANAPVTCSISGEGVFDGGTGGTSVGAVLYSRQTTSVISLKAKSATSVSSTIVSRGSSTITVDINDISSTGTTSNAAVWWYDGPMHVRANSITGSGPAVVYSTSPFNSGISNGYFWVRANEIKNTSMTISTTYKAVWLQDNEAAQRVWIDALQIRGPIAVQTTVTGALGYIRAEKIFGQINNASDSGLLYIDAQKVSDDGLGVPLLDQSSGGRSWINIDQWDDAGLTGINVVNISAGKSYLRFGSNERATAGTAFNVSGGELNLAGGRITTQGGSLDLAQSGGTLRVTSGSYDTTKTSGTIADDGAFVVKGGDLGMPSGGDATNLSNLQGGSVTGTVPAAATLWDDSNGNALISAGSGELDFNSFGSVVFGTGKAAIFRAGLGLGNLATQSGTYPQTTVSGNAGSATVLQTPRAINGVNFDGSAPITVGAWTSATAPVGALFTVSVTGINGLSTGYTTLFTVPSGKTFVLVSAQAIYTTVTGVDSQIPTWAIGRDSGTTITANTGPAASNVITGSFSSAVPSTNAQAAVAPAGSVVQYQQVQTGATATVITIKAVIVGYYY